MPAQLAVLLASWLLLHHAGGAAEKPACTDLGYGVPGSLGHPLFSLPLGPSHDAMHLRRFTGLQTCSDCDILAQYVNDAGGAGAS